MKIQLLLLFGLLFLVSAGCDSVQLKQEIPSSPEASYEVLPR